MAFAPAVHPREQQRSRGVSRASRPLRIWWDALSSGHFFTRWSLLTYAAVSMTALAPWGVRQHFTDYIWVLLVAFVSVAVMVVGLWPVIRLERTLPTRTSRGVVVLLVIVVGSAIRPLVQDAVGGLLGLDPIPDLPQRIATNLLAWLVMLSIIGVTTVRFTASENARRRMAEALAGFARADVRTRAFAEQSRAWIDDRVDELRLARDQLLAGDVTFESVSAFSQQVRRASHDFEARSRADLGVDGGAEEPNPADAGEPRPTFFERLRPPPFLSVALVYLCASIPYVYVVAGSTGALLSGTVVPAVGYLADLLIRMLPEAMRTGTRAAVFFVLWVSAGVIVGAVSWSLYPEVQIIALVPVVGIPSIAVVCALCADALARSEAQSTRQTRILSGLPNALASRSRSVRAPIRRAADLLHGRVQGRCVILAAVADEEPPSPEQLAAFRYDTDRAFDDVQRMSQSVSDTPRVDDVSELLDAWHHAMELDVTIDARAADTLADRDVSRRVAAAVNEGLVNAVKHSAAKTAEVLIEPVEGTENVLVVVASAGELGGDIDEGAGIGTLGPDTRLFQDGDQVVLESVITGRSHRSPHTTSIDYVQSLLNPGTSAP